MGGWGALYPHRTEEREALPPFTHSASEGEAIPKARAPNSHTTNNRRGPYRRPRFNRTQPTIQPAPNRRARFNPGNGIEADAPPAMIPKKNLCVTRCEAGLFSSPTKGTRDRAGHNAAEHLGAILRVGRRKRPDRTGGTGTGAALSLGAWNPKARGLKIRRLNGEKRTRAVKCGQHKPRYIPALNVKLYKIIDNYRN